MNNHCMLSDVIETEYRPISKEFLKEIGENTKWYNVPRFFLSVFFSLRDVDRLGQDEGNSNNTVWKFPHVIPLSSKHIHFIESY